MHAGYQIIIAEDEQILAALLTRLILRHYSTASIQTFGNGLEAFAAYDAAGADLLLVDHGIPGMDGPTLVRTVRARGDSVPIIGMSGDSSVQDAYLAAGATAFIDAANMIAQLPMLLSHFLPTLGLWPM